MPCFHPLKAVRDGGTVRVAGWKDRESQLERLALPCGSCLGCRTTRAREWAVRCALEEVGHPVSSFVTWTYDDKYLPPTLSRSALSACVKRLRTELHPSSVRFFACGEYGERTRRAHYHALLFGVRPESLNVSKCWRAWVCGRRHVHTDECATEPIGFQYVDVVTPARIAYVAGYVSKKLEVDYAPAHDRVDASTGEVYRYQPPFLQMSRRPGIGARARKYWRDWRAKAHHDGSTFKAPRYLHDAWKRAVGAEAEVYQVTESGQAFVRNEASEALREEKFAAWYESVKRGEDSPFHWKRVRDGEEIAKSRERLSQERRGLGV